VKRRGSQAVDLNAIPASMIDHIEILRDGVAAQYGSDGRVASGAMNYGFGFGQNGFLQLSGEVRDPQGTNRTLADRATRTITTSRASSTPERRCRMEWRCTASVDWVTVTGRRPVYGAARTTTALCATSIPTAFCRSSSRASRTARSVAA
jgi:hypothetical protein